MTDKIETAYIEWVESDPMVPDVSEGAWLLEAYRRGFALATKRAVEKCTRILTSVTTALNDAKANDAPYEVRLIHATKQSTINACITAIQEEES